MTVIDIRGTHGSGKSYIFNQITQMAAWEPIVGPGQATKGGPVKDRHLGYLCRAWNAAIVGNYESKSGFGGGCDLLFPEEVVKRVKMFYTRHRWVLLEGVLVAHTFQRYNDLAIELGDDYIFYFLDTPLQVCLDRIKKRQEDTVANKNRGFKTDSCEKDYRQIWKNVKRKLVEAGRRVKILHHENPVVELLEEMSLTERDY